MFCGGALSWATRYQAMDGGMIRTPATAKQTDRSISTFQLPAVERTRMKPMYATHQNFAGLAIYHLQLQHPTMHLPLSKTTDDIPQSTTY